MKQQAQEELNILYQRARHEWDERMGSAIAMANHWRLAALTSMAITFVAVVGVIYMGSQSKIQPYAVAIKNGEATAIGKIQQLPLTQQHALHTKALTDFVIDVRSVLADVQAQKTFITRAYQRLMPDTPALTTVDSYFKKNNVFEKAQTQLVTVNVTSVLPLSDNTYQVEWTESVTPRKGNVLPYTTRYKATMNTVTALPSNEKALVQNPLGFFINTFNYVKLT
ncbi:VirB8/TrbF family protein [Photobacterium leiognathi]|uniref:VirB8/TrbF family protein n=1 Tax=Photobacterium leiognathi TaxID=553611 RepID=UPI0029825552|nr:VirB8/TrbF family protein [Photobacterium leiognathi]